MSAATLIAFRCSLLPGACFALAGPEPGAAVEVTAPSAPEPLGTVLDPRQPRGCPARDGAEALRPVPGFALVRKGGSGGDPVLRGMAGSRLGILVDCEETPGGCGGRMDPPTAYVLPGAWDRVQVLKGPQTVLNGPGHPAGTVLFQRTPPRWEQSGWAAGGSWLAGGRDRRDRVLEVRAGTPRCYGRAIGADARSGDYLDGDGRAVHSRYRRWGAAGALGWTPGERVWLEVRGARGDGEAAYADRGMDGVSFLRSSLGLGLEVQDCSPRVAGVAFQAGWTAVDHVMDNGSLRTWLPAPGAPQPAVRNPRHITRTARLAVTLRPGPATEWILGAELKRSRHDVRMSRNAWSAPVAGRPRVADAELESAGLFGEGSRACAGGGRMVAGLRTDLWRAEDLRLLLPTGGPAQPDPTAGARRERLLPGGFVRREWALGPAAGYAGLGHAQRPPDYWELFPLESAGSPSAFGTGPERATQLDAGASFRSGGLKASLSGFCGVVSDFILIQSSFPKWAADGSPRAATIVRPILAATWGFEAAVTAVLAGPLQLDASLACAWGRNRTDGLPLAQMPPPEADLGLAWDQGAWSAGAQARLVAAQDRFAPGQGSIAGLDQGRTPGFALFSVTAGWRPEWAGGLRFSGGIDNLFDRACAEHVNRPSSAVPGYGAPAGRVPEPGRTFWARVSFRFP